MPSEHIGVNIAKPISPAAGAGISQDPTTRRTVALSVETVNKRLDYPPPHFTYNKLNKVLHKTVSAVTALLDASRPRGLHLARRVSSWTIFMGVFPILMSLLMTEAVAQTEIAPGPPRDFKATVGDRKVTMTWKPPSYTGSHSIDRYRAHLGSIGSTASGGAAARSHTFTGVNNGQTYEVKVQVIGSGPKGLEAFSETLTATPRIPAPTDFRAIAEDGQVTLSWTAPSGLAGNLTDYEYKKDSGDWTSIGLGTSRIETGLANGISYTFRVRGVRTGDPNNADPKGTASRTVTVTPLRAAPGAPGTLNVKRVEDTAILTWSPPSNTEEGLIVRYEYSSDGGATWKSTRSSSTTYTVRGLEIGKEYTFRIRAVYIGGGTSQRVISFSSGASNAVAIAYTPPPKEPPPPKKSHIFECPVGWQRSDRFAGRTRRALLYEVKVEMDIHNRVSIYKPVSVAIYVHPDERLETLDGWKLQVAIPYNHHREYLLTAENSVVVASKMEGVAGGFAFIANPEATPFPMVGMGFTGSLVPGFDYRLYDDTGKRVDFGIACYKRSDIFQVLKAMEAPSVLRKVDLETFDWDAPYLRSEWTVPVPVNVPGAPSLQGVNLVEKWADLKKQ